MHVAAYLVLISSAFVQCSIFKCDRSNDTLYLSSDYYEHLKMQVAREINGEGRTHKWSSHIVSGHGQSDSFDLFTKTRCFNDTKHCHSCILKLIDQINDTCGNSSSGQAIEYNQCEVVWAASPVLDDDSNRTETMQHFCGEFTLRHDEDIRAWEKSFEQMIAQVNTSHTSSHSDMIKLTAHSNSTNLAFQVQGECSNNVLAGDCYKCLRLLISNRIVCHSSLSGSMTLQPYCDIRWKYVFTQFQFTLQSIQNIHGKSVVDMNEKNNTSESESEKIYINSLYNNDVGFKYDKCKYSFYFYTKCDLAIYINYNKHANEILTSIAHHFTNLNVQIFNETSVLANYIDFNEIEFIQTGIITVASRSYKRVTTLTATLAENLSVRMNFFIDTSHLRVETLHAYLSSMNFPVQIVDNQLILPFDGEIAFSASQRSNREKEYFLPQGW